jgi:hypothetical protein
MLAQTAHGRDASSFVSFAVLDFPILNYKYYFNKNPMLPKEYSASKTDSTASHIVRLTSKLLEAPRLQNILKKNRKQKKDKKGKRYPM